MHARIKALSPVDALEGTERTTTREDDPVSSFPKFGSCATFRVSEGSREEREGELSYTIAYRLVGNGEFAVLPHRARPKGSGALPKSEKLRKTSHRERQSFQNPKSCTPPPAAKYRFRQPQVVRFPNESRNKGKACAFARQPLRTAMALRLNADRASQNRMIGRPHDIR